MRIKNGIIIASYFLVLIIHADELLFLHNLKQTIPIDELTFASLIEQASSRSTPCTIQSTTHIPLFAAYPSLHKRIHSISLGTFPTPIQKLTSLESLYTIQNLFIKQDSFSGGITFKGTQLFGGNKVRKLEFLLADALSHRAKSVLTFGCIGSNHAVATATYAEKLGLRCYLMLTPQPDSPAVQKNLARMHAAHAEIITSNNSANRIDNTIKTFMQSKTAHGDYPYFIPTGGSTALGAVGFVNAAFELREQINQGFLPKPDYIYVATGSFGTVAGLSLGLKAAGIDSQVIAVYIEPENVPGSVEQKINLLFKKTNELLHKSDETFPLFESAPDNVTIIYDFGGASYGLCTQEGYNAIQDAQQYENIYLDATYTGKAFAALAAHGQQGMLKDKNVLFWNTYYSDAYTY